MPLHRILNFSITLGLEIYMHTLNHLIKCACTCINLFLKIFVSCYEEDVVTSRKGSVYTRLSGKIPIKMKILVLGWLDLLG